MHMTARRGQIVILLALFALPTALQAGGFSIYQQGAQAMGFAGAVVAQASDPSTIFYNPAGVGFLKGRQIYIGGAIGSQSTDFTGEGPYPPVGTKETSDNGLKALPTVYYSHQFSQQIFFGLGFNKPFGTSSNWTNPNDFSGRFVSLEGKIQSYALSPVVAFKLADRLSVGFGVDLRFSEFSQTRRLLPSPNPFAPELVDVAERRLSSDWSTGVGFNIGLLAKPSDAVSIGISYRHKVRQDYTGSASFSQINTGNAAVDAAVKLNLPAQQSFETAIEFPASLAGGLAYRFGDWTAEGDVVWFQWSSLDQLNFHFPAQPTLDQSLPLNYESTILGSLGLERRIGDRYAVRGGVGYDHSPQPTSTLSPFLHDEDHYLFSLGGTWRSGNVFVDGAFSYVLVRDRSTSQASAYGYNGLYQSSLFSFGVNLGYRF
jgi:long-chain fatty acid transport protein